jgi:hypothetical protein
MTKNIKFILPPLKPRKTLIALLVVSGLLLSFQVVVLQNISKNINILAIQPSIAQQVSIGDAWQKVYQQIPDFPKENNYISQESGKVAANNTLANRIILYHSYVKGRAPNFRLDWKLTLADYLGENEVMYEKSYPGNDTLKKNPLEPDKLIISKLTRRQRDDLVQALVNTFTSK